METLLEKAEQYKNTSIELLKLKSIEKTANAASAITSRLLLFVIVLLFIFFLSFAAALWLGELLGRNYFGFLIVTAFYVILSIIFYFIHPFIKGRINNSYINQMLN